MSNVVNLETVTRLPLPVTRIIDAIPRDMDRVLVIGITADGEEYFASSDPDGGTIIWDMERAKLKLLRLADSE